MDKRDREKERREKKKGKVGNGDWFVTLHCHATMGEHGGGGDSDRRELTVCAISMHS